MVPIVELLGLLIARRLAHARRQFSRAMRLMPKVTRKVSRLLGVAFGRDAQRMIIAETREDQKWPALCVCVCVVFVCSFVCFIDVITCCFIYSLFSCIHRFSYICSCLVGGGYVCLLHHVGGHICPQTVEMVPIKINCQML